MRIYSFLFLICLAMVASSAAQPSGEIAYFHANRVKPGMTEQYESTRKRHWVWHQKMGDTWAFHVWQIVSGEASGTYMVCSFGHTWKEVDESDAKVGGEEEPGASVEPFLDAEWESYHRYLPDLSIAPSGNFSPVAKLAVERFVLKPDGIEEFLATEAKIKKALVKNGYQGTVRWYRLVTGGEAPQVLMLADRANWAAYDSEESVESTLQKTYGKHGAAAILGHLSEAVRSQYVETWQYRPELSFVPAAK